MGSFYQLLGLDPDATVDEIKKSYRALAKQYHPDKNIGDNTTELFQRLNSAYHTLTNPVSRREYDASLGISRVDEEQILDNSNYTLNARENTHSVTIDISESMFLVLLEESQRHHDTKPTDRGHHGLQLRAPYVSPSDQVQYGTISLTFYPSTSRLLVQGTSYMLWVEEHLSLIYQSAEINYMENALKWCNLSTQQQIGRNKRRSALRGRTRQDTPSPSEAAPVTLCLPTSPTKAPSLPPGNNGASDPDPMVQEGDKTTINYCPSGDAPDMATSEVPDAESLRSPIAPQHPRAGIPTRNFACVPKNSGAKKCTTKQGKKKKQKSKEPKMNARPIKKTLKPDKKSNSATTKSDYHKTTPMVMNDGNEQNGVSPQHCKENFLFHHFPRRHIHKKAKGASGGIGIFVKSHLRESVTVSHAVEHCVWVLIRNRNRDCPNINIGCVYIPPVDTSYCHPEITDYYSTLGKEILGKEKAGRIILCGDFNARTGDLTDYAETNNDLFVYHDHTTEPLKMQRFNPDKKVKSYGRELAELCQGSGLQILNGRDNFSDATSKFTCFKRQGKRVVDYLIANALTAYLIHNFEIHERRADSDHAALSYEIEIPVNSDNTSPTYQHKIVISVESRLPRCLH